jgi:hypothetical protein
MILEQLGVADVATQRIEIDVIPAAAVTTITKLRFSPGNRRARSVGASGLPSASRQLIRGGGALVRLCPLPLCSRWRERHAMHDRDPTEQFRAPAREPKPGTFHRPAHGFGMKRVREAAEVRLRGPMTGEQKLGEGLRELPLVGNAGAAARRARLAQTDPPPAQAGATRTTNARSNCSPPARRRAAPN